MLGANCVHRAELLFTVSSRRVQSARVDSSYRCGWLLLLVGGTSVGNEVLCRERQRIADLQRGMSKMGTVSQLLTTVKWIG